MGVWLKQTQTYYVTMLNGHAAWRRPSFSTSSCEVWPRVCLTSRAVSVQVLVQSMSLFAWLATGPSFSRHYQQNTVAFALKDRTRKRVNLGVSPCLGVELDGQAESQVMCGLA